jgi:hypothetical protein
VGWEGRPTAEEVGRPRRCVTKRATILRGEVFVARQRSWGCTRGGTQEVGGPGGTSRKTNNDFDRSSFSLFVSLIPIISNTDLRSE